MTSASSNAPTYSRFIHTRFGARQVTDLLQAIFAAELVMPSHCLWIVYAATADAPCSADRHCGVATKCARRRVDEALDDGCDIAERRIRH